MFTWGGPVAAPGARIGLTGPAAAGGAWLPGAAPAAAEVHKQGSVAIISLCELEICLYFFSERLDHLGNLLRQMAK